MVIRNARRAAPALCFALLPFVAPEGAAIPRATLAKDAPGLAREAGVLTYRGEPFSGWVIEREGEHLVARSPYLRGKEHGIAAGFYPDGSPRYLRVYEHGRREGTHRGYWQNGLVQYVYRYEGDLLEGEQVAFFKTGAPAELRHYHQGREDGLQRSYDGDGRIVANYTWKNGRRYGIVGRFDCVSMGGAAR
jgi:antitoxin component YwqK of YwqJK toxin-antitoxin module